MALKVLIGDPDEEWLDAAKKHLVDDLYVVDVVTNGKDFQLAMYNETYFAVIVNYELKNHTGMQVLKFIKANYTSLRAIMLVKDEKIFEEEDIDEDYLSRNGATEIVIGPIEMDELSRRLEGQQSLGDLISHLPKNDGVGEEVEVDASDEEFTKVKIDDFYSAKAVLFDVFIQLNSGKYVKILHAGDNFTKDRIDKYKKEKGVTHLFFHQKDRRKFIQYNNHFANKVIENPNLPTKVKIDMMKSVSEKYLEELFSEGMKPQVIEQGKEVCENIFNIIEGEKDLFQLLKSYQDFDPDAYTHSFLTTLFSSSIIKQFEWQSKSTIETTAMACMFHDIGKMKLPKEFLELRPEDMTEDQLVEYQTHPQLGLEMVESNRLINNSIKQIILQHHEYYNGTGFPKGIKGKAVFTLANIVCLANDFVHLIMQEKIKPVEGLKKLLEDEKSTARYNSKIIECFIQSFVDPEKIKKETHLPSNSRLVNKKVS